MPKLKQTIGEDSVVELKKKITALRKDLKEVKDNALGKPICVCCGKHSEPYSFYNSLNPLHTGNDGKIPYCKECMNKIYQELENKYNSETMAIYYLCRKLNLFFSSAALESARKNSKNTNWSLLASYIKEISSLNASLKYGKSFDESVNFLDIEEVSKKIIEEHKTKIEEELNDNINDKVTKLDKSNREDCIKLLGYDPFADEDNKSKKFLYNTLIEYLNEETLDDPFKLSSCIEITKIFGQIDLINKAIATVASNSETLADNPVALKSLVDSKKNLYNSALGLAKDNGVSLNNSTNKAIGAGTLTGLMKKFGDLNLRDADINKFDVDTCEGFRQVAKISNDTIIDKLNLKEDDWSDMVKQLRDVRVKQDEELKILREELRLTKIELLEKSKEDVS